MISNSNCNNHTGSLSTNQKSSAKTKRTLFEDKYLINQQDLKLLEFFGILVDISVNIIVEFYMNKKFILAGGYLENMKEYKSEIINKLIDLLFDSTTAKNSYFNVVFEDINKKFLKDKMVFIIYFLIIYFIFCYCKFQKLFKSIVILVILFYDLKIKIFFCFLSAALTLFCYKIKFLTSGFIRLVGYPFICEYNNRREQELVEKARMCCFISY